MPEKKGKTENLFREIIRDTVAPPPDLTVSEWSDQYRYLSSEGSAEPGKWRTDRAPYQREMLNAINDPHYVKVVIMASAQVGKSEILLNALGYHIDYDPAPILMVQPTDTMAKNFSKERIDPMVRDTPSLRNKVADVKSRDSGNTTLRKTFIGGYVALIGANAPSGLASRPIRILLADEIDRYPFSAGSEGDPLSLAEKRTTTFWNRKIVMASTPTIKGASRIESEFELSTKERFHVPCPSCGEYQPFLWPQMDFETKSMRCPCCGYLHSEIEWKQNMIHGKWIAENPDAPIRGFHLNELLSPWKKWSDIIDDFHEAKRKGLETLKVWVNTSLGETWEEKGTSLKSHSLEKRGEDYGDSLPESVVCLTMGVDTQDNRLEYEIIGWGIGKESWGVRYGVIMGDPGQREVWDDLDLVLKRKFKRVDGIELPIMTTCIDSGGHHTESVYDYCKAREFQRVWAIKGKGGSGIPFIMRPKRRNDEGVWLFNIGVDVGKDVIVSRLQSSDEQEGYCHFPKKFGYDHQYYEGLTAERRVTKYQNGQTRIIWEKKTSGARNEPFDLRNYATAALEILNPPLEELNDLLIGKQKQTEKPREISRKTGLVSKVTL
jgi:phage terminase large subunit GpA-like protein